MFNLSFLDGYKTNIVAVLGVVLVGLIAFGQFSPEYQDAIEKGVQACIFGGFAALRDALKKSSIPKPIQQVVDPLAVKLANDVAAEVQKKLDDLKKPQPVAATLITRVE